LTGEGETHHLVGTGRRKPATFRRWLRRLFPRRVGLRLVCPLSRIPRGLGRMVAWWSESPGGEGRRKEEGRRELQACIGDGRSDVVTLTAPQLPIMTINATILCNWVEMAPEPAFGPVQDHHPHP
jgi:hypothetical protein